MPNPYIEWTDSTGLARLTCLVPTLSGWTPDVDPIGPSEVALGSGQTFQWVFRTDQVVKFTLPYISPAQASEMLRLKAHLLGGGSVTVFTGDGAARVYTCRIRPETVPVVNQDPESGEFALVLELLNTGGTPMLALWSPVGLLFTPDTDYLALGGTFTRAQVATYFAGP